MRAIIRVTLRDVTDDQALQVKKAVEAAVKDFPEAEIELNLMPR